MRNEKNILQHEFIGLTVRVIRSRHNGYLAKSGTVVDETKNMLIIDTGKKRVKIPKTGNTFIFQLESGPIIIEGEMILARSEERTKKLGRNKIQKKLREIQDELSV